MTGESSNEYEMGGYRQDPWHGRVDGAGQGGWHGTSGTRATRTGRICSDATPPIEMMRYMISRQATRRKDGRERKSMHLDKKKAHVIPLCEQDVYVELPAEAEVQEGRVRQVDPLVVWVQTGGQAWEEHYSALLKEHGFQRLRSVPVAFVHENRDLMGVVHGDDFVFVALDEDLDFVLKILGSRNEIKKIEVG